MASRRETRMGAGAGVRRATGSIATVLLVLACGVPLAHASTDDIIAPSDPNNPQADSGWQAGTCTKDTPTCSVATPTQFFEQAAGHPKVGFTQFIVKHESPGETPVDELKTVRVDLPVGLSVNPGATPRCKLSTFQAGAAGCPPLSEVGFSQVTTSLPPLGKPAPPTAPLT